MTEEQPESDAAPQSKPRRRCEPDALFESLARWLGFALIVTGMYYELELERSVNNLIYVIGGVLAGVGSVLGKYKP